MQRATGPQQFFSLLGEWNAMYPEWAFKNTTNFGYEARQAVNRLVAQVKKRGQTGEEED
jgi:hypothetical protein